MVRCNVQDKNVPITATYSGNDSVTISFTFNGKPLGVAMSRRDAHDLKNVLDMYLSSGRDVRGDTE